MKMDKLDTIKKKLISALEDNLGIVTAACKQVKVARATYYNWYNNDKDFRASVDDIQDQTLDFVETQLHKKIKDGDTTSIIFYCKTKGKKRGYVERQEIKHDVDAQSKIYEWKPATEKK
mgnify:FL=1|tara:strand:+ start:770 stop:1126 length:357 start_codon:yes stop_codon:yes gene_type:complete